MKFLKIFMVSFLFLTVALGCYGQRLPIQIKNRMDEAMSLIEESPDSALKMSWRIWEDVEEGEGLYLMAVVRSFLGYQVGDDEMAYMNCLSAYDLLQRSDTLDYYNLSTVITNLATLLEGYDMHEEAIVLYREEINYIEQYLKHFPNSARSSEFEMYKAEAKFNLAIQLGESGALSEAKRLLDELLESFESYSSTELTWAVIMNELGTIAKKDNDPIHAIECFLEITKSFKSDSADRLVAYHNLGIIYQGIDSLSISERWFRNALDNLVGFGDENLHFSLSLGLGEVLFGQQRYEEAVICWKVCLEAVSNLKEPERYIVYDWLSRGYRAIDRSDWLQYIDFCIMKEKISMRNLRVSLDLQKNRMFLGNLLLI